MHAGVHCTALHQSQVDKRLFFLLFLFFSCSWLREKPQVPAELEMDVPAPVLSDFSPALQSHPGRRIMKRPALPRSPAMVSCKYLVLISLRLYFLLYRPPLSVCVATLLCTLFSHLFVFILTFMRCAQPSLSVQLLLSYILFPKWEKKGCAELQKGQLPQYLESWSAFCHSCRVRVKVTNLKFTARLNESINPHMGCKI